MSSDLAIDTVRQALLLAVMITSPLLLANFAASFVVSLLQAMTGIQDATVSLAPRLAIGTLMLLWLLPWMLDQLTEFSVELYRGIPN